MRKKKTEKKRKARQALKMAPFSPGFESITISDTISLNLLLCL